MICAPGYTMVAGQCVARVEPTPAAQTLDIGGPSLCVIVLLAAALGALIAWVVRR